jgi:hypothetical protein
MRSGVVIALFASSALCACPKKPPPGGGVPAGPFTLTGTVTVNNDCDGKLESVPNNITVKAEIFNAAGNISVPGTANIALAGPGPNPTKTGTYTITANWPGGAAGPAVNWGAFSETLVGGGDICKPIACEQNTCQNLATRVRTTPVTGGNTTNDVRINCTCAG